MERRINGRRKRSRNEGSRPVFLPSAGLPNGFIDGGFHTRRRRQRCRFKERKCFKQLLLLPLTSPFFDSCACGRMGRPGQTSSAAAKKTPKTQPKYQWMGWLTHHAHTRSIQQNNGGCMNFRAKNARPDRPPSCDPPRALKYF